jgi:WD40 repeat protein
MSLASCPICHEPLLTPGAVVCHCSGPNGKHFAARSGPQLLSGKVSRRHLLAGLWALPVAGSALTWLQACAPSAVGSGTTPISSTRTPPKSGTSLLTYTGHSALVFSVAWSPDSQHLISSSFDATTRVWDAKSGQTRFTLQRTQPVDQVAWSPDGQTLATAGFNPNDPEEVTTNVAQLWNATTGALLLTYTAHATSVRAVAWSPDSRRLATLGDATPNTSPGVVHVWEAATGKRLRTYSGALPALAWSPDGTRIAQASFDKTVQIWEAATGKHLLSYTGHPTPVRSLAWSPDGSRIASVDGTDHDAGEAPDRSASAHVWDAHSGKLLLKYTGHTDTLWGVSWSPSSQRIVTCSFDGTTQIWDAANGRPLLLYRITLPVQWPGLPMACALRRQPMQRSLSGKRAKKRIGSLLCVDVYYCKVAGQRGSISTMHMTFGKTALLPKEQSRGEEQGVESLPITFSCSSL